MFEGGFILWDPSLLVEDVEKTSIHVCEISKSLPVPIPGQVAGLVKFLCASTVLLYYEDDIMRFNIESHGL